MKWTAETFLSMLFLSLTMNAQTFDTASVVYTAKLAAFSNYRIVPNVTGFHQNLRVTSYEFLKHSGFDNICFIKIKIRPRIVLEEYLFYEGLTEEEHRKYIVLDDVMAIKMLKDTIALKYHITDSTENNIIEKLLPKNSAFFDTMRNNALVDYYFVYLIKEDRLLYLKNSRNIVNDSSAFWRAFYSMEIMSSEFRREITIKNIPKSHWRKMVKIEGFEILNN